MKTLGIYVATTALLLLALALGYFAMDWRSPDFAGYRRVALVVAVAVALLIVLAAVVAFLRGRTGRWHRGASGLALLAGVIAAAALGQVIVMEGRFQWMRYTVLNSDPATLEALGQHFIVGYRNREEVSVLGQRKAVAGFFITHHNVGGMDESAIRQEIHWLRSTLPAQDAHPMWIATDQEGGGVSRLSPPLPRQPALGRVLEEQAPGSTIESASLAYGRRQGEGLASLGVNLNLSPVVDIDHQVDNPADRFTRISTRALSDDPAVVTEAAGAYCQGLAAFGVQCTLKHFPGIGRVFHDTHVERAVLSESPDQLRESDWLPFLRLAGSGPPPWIMLSHVILAQVDPDRPVSTSTPVVQGLLRDQWSFQGVLITDDFCMRAIHDAPGGVGQATVDALNAGVDIILISFDPDQYYLAMYALLQADREGKLDWDVLRRSKQRLMSSGSLEG
ncbi:glycoside hydrolase family 3 N-terminal domain-containing protein [Marinobacter sp. LN3S78]|uniref:glycoside hydrolase family 3 N-terminal domain-containing protein n=1 Tax=Marinobacter sp. LN3S78 TaxID=3382300 RepID=UPI00387ACBDA